MTSPAALTTHHATLIPPEGTPVILVVEDYDLHRDMLVKLAQRARLGVRIVVVPNMDMVRVALAIHGPDIIGVTTNMRIGGGPQNVIDMVETVLGRAVPWGILTGAIDLPSPGEFRNPPVAIVEKIAGPGAIRDLFRLLLLFAPPASPAAGEATAS